MDVQQLDLPPPRNWQDFEDLCHAIWQREWRCPMIQKHGRSGQVQSGVDIFGKPNGQDRFHGIQCKLKAAGQKLTVQEVSIEVQAAAVFTPPLAHLIIATTAPADVKIQRFARELNAQQSKERSFEIDVLAWPEIVLRLVKYADLAARLYPGTDLAAQGRRVRALAELAPLPLASYHFSRAGALRQLKDTLLSEHGFPVGITGQTRFGLFGMGGIGKTSLASELASDPEVKSHFSDGILWATFGRQIDLLQIQQRFAEALGDGAFDCRSPTTANRRLAEISQRTKALLILDDVWEVEHARGFYGIGGGCRVVVTTRNRRILQALDAGEVTVEALHPLEALTFLAHKLDTDISDLLPEAAEIVKECGYVPFAISIIGALIKTKRLLWSEALTRLRNADIRRLEALFAAYEHTSLVRALEVSIEMLGDREREAFQRCSVFQDDAIVPVNVFYLLWSNICSDAIEARGLAIDLCDRCLLIPTAGVNEGDQRYRLHDLYSDYLRATSSPTRAQYHQVLVERYRATAPAGWASIVDDDYIFRFLPWHLSQAGLKDELEALLFDAAWLQAKMLKVGCLAIEADFALCQSRPAATRVARALGQSRHLINRYPLSMGQQIAARINDDTDSCLRKLKQQLFLSRAPQVLWPKWPSIHTSEQLLHTLWGHSVAVTALAITPDGRRVVSASSYGKFVRIWDLETGVLLHTLKDHNGSVEAIALTPDGRHAISASDDRTLRIWDIRSDTPVLTLEGHRSYPSAVAITPDGRRVISGGSFKDGKLMVWDFETGALLHSLDAHDKAVSAIALTPDGGRAVSASKDDTLKVWDIDAGKLLHTLEGHHGGVQAVITTTDGRSAVSASSDHTLKVWDLETGALLRNLQGHRSAVYAVAISPDGRHVVSGSGDGTLKVWCLDTGAALRSLEGHRDGVYAVAITPDGRRAVSGSDDSTLKVWDLESGSTLCTFEGHSDTVLAVAITPNGRRAVSASADRTLKVWDIDRTGEPFANSGHSGPVRAVALSRDGQRAVSASDETTIKVWNVETGALIHRLEGHREPISAIVLTPNGRQAVSGSLDATVKIWDLDTGTVVHTLKGHTEKVLDLAMLPDGDRVISASFDGTLKLWDLGTGVLLSTLDGDMGPVWAPVPTPDGRRVVSAYNIKGVKVWDMTTGNVDPLEDPNDEAFPDALAADGRRAVVACSNYTLKIWDLETGALTNSRGAHSSTITAVVITPDGRRAVTASKDTTLKVWNLETGDIMHTLEGHEDEISALGITSDGTRVISASRDMTIVLWNIAQQKPGYERFFMGDAPFERIAISSLSPCTVIFAGDGTGRVHALID